jgi:hypothetical protein
MAPPPEDIVPLGAFVGTATGSGCPALPLSVPGAPAELAVPPDVSAGAALLAALAAVVPADGPPAIWPSVLFPAPPGDEQEQASTSAVLAMSEIGCSRPQGIFAGEEQLRIRISMGPFDARSQFAPAVTSSQRGNV